MLLLSLSTPALAVEGMWLPQQMPALQSRLAEAGFQGDAALLSRFDQAPLGAVVSMGGCTASFVSPDGLLVTNHHCVTGMLVQAQKEGENLLKTGIYAPTRAEERMGGAAARVTLVERAEDVTAKIVGSVSPKLGDLDRKLLVEDRLKKVTARCEADNPGRRCKISSYYGGQSYQMTVAVELRDVRMVYAPPEAVGNYGDEIDNWHWPRHAGDFAFFRAYVGADGKPADFAAGNVPYRPAHHLKLAARGPAPGEFVLVAGYPGGTGRWLTGIEVDRFERVEGPDQLRYLTWLWELLNEAAEADPANAGMLSTKGSFVGNGMSKVKGELAAFARSGVAAAALDRDAKLRAWVRSDPTREARYGAALDELARLVTRREATWARDTALARFLETDQIEWARRLYRVAQERAKPDPKREMGFQERDLARLRQRLDSEQRWLHVPSERTYFEATLADVLALPADQAVPEVAAWVAGRSPRQLADEVYAASSAVDTSAERLALFDAPPSAFVASKDPFVRLAVALGSYEEARRKEEKEDAGAALRLRPLHAEAFQAFDPLHAYPDANGTLRVTFGTVQGYRPADAVTYGPQTTLEGIVAKAGPWPFDAPPALLDAIRAGKRGPYADPALGSVPVDFLSDLDITGGNSGSPTLNARGELVGLAFDGNVEGIASDWLFDPALARTIHVDLRYLLYYLDAVAGADALLAELGVKPAF